MSPAEVFYEIVATFTPANMNELRTRAALTGVALISLAAGWLLGWMLVRLITRKETRIDENDWLDPVPAQPDGLVVLVHGWLGSRKTVEPMAQFVRSIEQFSNYRFHFWSYDSRRLSNANPDALANDLASRIESLQRANESPIILMGHSIGGLLIRRAFLLGYERQHRWPPQVRRIVLFAAPNRGIGALWRSRGLRILDFLARSYNVGWLIRSLYRGAPFVVNLRIAWIRKFAHLERPPVVAQIIGRNDSRVNVSDSLDVLQFTNSVSRQCAGSTHTSIIRPSESGEFVREVLLHNAPDRAGTQSAAPVFKLLVVHGIRDYGDRFTALAAEARTLASRLGFQAHAASPRYHYFSALQFVLPSSRRSKVHDFADIYAEMLAQAPVDTPIHFAGHSFGTYLMGRCVRDYAEMRFERVYLAGSVLSENYFVDLAQETPHGSAGCRIGPVRNDIAAKDWPVGLLCAGLDQLGLVDSCIGIGGFTGFAGNLSPPTHVSCKYFAGGHGKALETPNLPTVAAWLLDNDGEGARYDEGIVDGELKKSHMIVDARPQLWSLASRASGGLFALASVALLYPIVLGQHPIAALVLLALLLWLLNII